MNESTLCWLNIFETFPKWNPSSVTINFSEIHFLKINGFDGTLADWWWHLLSPHHHLIFDSNTFLCGCVKQTDWDGCFIKDIQEYVTTIHVCMSCALFHVCVYMYTSQCCWVLCKAPIAWGPGLPGWVNKLTQQIMFKSFSLRPGKTKIHYSWLLLPGI